MNNLDVLGTDSNMRHPLLQADCFINNSGWWKIFLQLLYSYTKHASFPHSSWSNRWIGGWKNCQNLQQGHLVLKKNTPSLFASFLNFSECVVYWGSVFCKKLLMMGVNAPGLASEQACMGNEEIWVHTELCWQQLTSSKIFRPLGARGKKTAAAFFNGFQVFI